MAGDINRVTLVGRLTRDPELRHLPSGSPVLQLGVACNGRQKDEAGNWTDKPNFFDVKVFGNQAEMLSQHLAKGRRKLAYEIDKKSEGTYHLLHFDSDAETLGEVTRVLKITDGAMRHMAVRRPVAKPRRTEAVQPAG